MKIVKLFLTLALLLPSESFAAQTFKGRILNNVAASSDQSSAAVDISNWLYGSFQIKWASLTGTIDGTAKVQVSNDDGVSWDDISGASLTLSGASGHDTISLSGVMTEDRVRVTYTHGNISGGTINCYAIMKQ